MRAVKDDFGNTAIVMDDEEEYLLNTQRCARCQHSFQCEGDFRFYCRWREDCCCIGDWADCSGYQPKGEREVWQNMTDVKDAHMFPVENTKRLASNARRTHLTITKE